VYVHALALVLSRARRRVAVVDAGAPRNAPAAHLHGFLSRDGLPPHDLLAIGRQKVASYGGLLIGLARPRQRPAPGVGLRRGRPRMGRDRPGRPYHDRRRLGRRHAADPRAQVVTAAGEGSTAAIALNANLVDDDVRDAVRNYLSATLP
jgi:hypothetical protein